MTDENYIKEKELANLPKSISIEALRFLIPKTETSICKIYCKDGGHGTGFFCNIQYNYNTILKVFMTNNHVLNEEDIKIGNTIKFSINNEKIFYEIKLDESRKIYTNYNYDITIIELKPNDKLDQISYFDIDNRIFQDNLKDIFNNEQIYLLHYPKGNKMEYSNGLIKGINEDNYTIRHLCDSSGGSSGSPIINTINFQVLGIHKGGAQGAKNYNLGTILKEPIKEFINKEGINNNINYNINKINIKNECIKENENINKENEINEGIDTNEDNDEIIIQYKVDKIKYSKDIRIFGDEFVENNKDKCKIIINGNEFELVTHININKKQLNNNKIFEIKLKGIKQITNASSMFDYVLDDETPLFSLPDISKWNTLNVTDMSNMFRNCQSLLSLPDISKWNTQNVTDMSNMFGCILLTSIPDISNWNTQNVKNMSFLFGCFNLLSLPDISKWNTQNVTNMNNLFSYCKSLSSLPDISKWNTQNVIDMNAMFKDCSSLITLPDISKWNTQNVTTMGDSCSSCSCREGMFINCSSLIFLPDISKWNTENVTDMSYMFSGCKSLSSLPDISKWNTKNVKSFRGMFDGCSSLSSLPDISKWDTQKVVTIERMFYNCSSLTSLPDITKWDTQNISYIYEMFKGTNKNLNIPEIFKEEEKKCIIF